MENYKDLGKKYLQKNKRRNFITMLGCFIVSAVLFMFLNAMVCWVEKCRIDARAEDDWEILVLTDDKDTIEKITNENFVKSAYLGKAYSYFTDEYIDEHTIYANALHINVDHKLLINYYSKYIEKNYNVNVELNDLLSWTYCQDNEGIGYLMLLGGLFIAFVMAIIGVGVLRNNISISAIERVKDYGNLRCIGATKKQIKAIVYRESFFLETVGMAAGILAGFLLSIPICMDEKRQYPIGFHIIPVILLAIAFYGDMYFAVDDGLKKVLKVSPAEAVRGNYRIKARGIKRRHSGIWGLIFGIEGDYAYKNIKRNNGRFIRTVTALVFGMIIVVVGGGAIGQFYDFKSKVDDMYGYYQQSIEGTTNGVYSYEEQRMDLYSPEALQKISSAKGIEGPKFMYQETLYTAEDQWLLKNMNEDYATNTYETVEYNLGDQVWTEEDIRFWTEYKDEETGKTALESWREHHPEYEADATPWDQQAEKQAEDKAERKAYRDTGKGLVDYESKEVLDPKNYEVDYTEYGNLASCALEIDAYDDEDYARFNDYLIDGTTELSENGVLLVNQAQITPADAYENNAIYADLRTFTFLDVKVGDEITIVDPAELYRLVQDELKNAKAYDEEIQEKADEWDREHKDEVDENGDPVRNPYNEYSNIIGNNRKQAWIINSAREKLVDEGKFKTYVIEGIVSENPNAGKFYPTLITTLDKFYEMTGRTESDYMGMCFHISNAFSSDLRKTDFQNAIKEKQNTYYYGEEIGPTYNSYTSPFIDVIGMMVTAVKTMAEVMALLAILVIISLLNTVNVTISSLQTRRNEFAQLRAIGMTKKSLLKAVLLEGGIVWIIATVLGILLGIAIEIALYKTLVVLIIDADMVIVWPVIILVALLSFVVLCGSNYIIFKQMNLNVAEELTRSGE